MTILTDHGYLVMVVLKFDSDNEREKGMDVKAHPHGTLNGFDNTIL